MFLYDHDNPKSETLTDLAAFTGPADFGAVVSGRCGALPEDLHHAFNANQVASKTWLLDRVHDTLGGHFASVHVLGGWYGALAALMFDDVRFHVDRVVSYDIDPACAPVATSINAEAAGRGRFEALTADAAKLDYAMHGVGGNGSRALIVNTSCEHMAEPADWYDRIPARALVVVQSNNYFECPEHVNCVADLAELKGQVPMSELYYEGTLRRRRYSRFMLIGKK